MESGKTVDGRAGVWLTWSGLADNPGKENEGRVQTSHTPNIRYQEENGELFFWALANAGPGFEMFLDGGAR